MTYRVYNRDTPITRDEWNACRKYVEGIYPCLKRKAKPRVFAYWACRYGLATIDTRTFMEEVAAGHPIID